MVDIAYAKAFSEVLAILRYISKEEYEKIPLEIIEVMEDNCLKEIVVEYNPNLSLNDQNFSKEAKTIIALFFRDYWATDVQREKILLKEKQDNQLQEFEKQQKFNGEIFKNRTANSTSIPEQQKKETQLIVIEENTSFFKKILQKIKKLLLG